MSLITKSRRGACLQTLGRRQLLTVASTLIFCMATNLRAQTCELSGKEINFQYKKGGENVTLQVVGNKVLFHLESHPGETPHGWVYYLGQTINALTDPIEKPGLEYQLKYEAANGSKIEQFLLTASWDGSTLRIAENDWSMYPGIGKMKATREWAFTIEQCRTCVAKHIFSTEGVGKPSIQSIPIPYCTIH